MRINEIDLTEVKVFSSWIEDLTYKDGVTWMALQSGREYRIIGIKPELFRQWVMAGSKGKFWHSHIRGNYRVSRVL